jgi:hypothetical protein
LILSVLCEADARERRFTEARQIEQKLAAGVAQGCAFDIAIGEHRSADADAIMEKLAGSFPQGDLGASSIGNMYADAGETGKALTWFARAYETREFGLFTIAYDRGIAPEFFALQGWKALADRPLFQGWRVAHDQVEKEFAASSLQN